MIEAIGWFFFDLLILGYIEDKDTGLSFQLPIGLGWIIYVEVPSRDLAMNPHDMLKHFCDDIPTLGLLGTPHLIPSDTPFIIDDDAQLVCKYLKAYKEKRIDRLYKQSMQVFVDVVTIFLETCTYFVTVLIYCILIQFRSRPHDKHFIVSK